MNTLNDEHSRFASLFKNKAIQAYAFWVSKKIKEGSICVDLDELNEKSLEESPFPEFVPDKKELLALSDFVSEDPEYKTPFILYHNKLYLHRFFSYESQILNKIISLIQEGKKLESARKKQLENLKASISKLFDQDEDCEGLSEEECIDWQRIAALNTLLSNFSIITGGPGTGKTTTVAKILALLLEINPDEKIALAAQTGKAAMRMAESLRNTHIPVSEEIKNKLHSLEPFTIHRLLKSKLNSPYFKHNKEYPLDYHTIIIDESSMIDAGLFFKLITALKENSRIILLGDKNQLASVEAGSIFGDLCETKFKLNSFTNERMEFLNSFINEEKRKIKLRHCTSDSSSILLHQVTELKRSRRFRSQEGIGKLSQSILNESEDQIEEFILNQNDQIEIDTSYSETIFNQYVLLYKEYIEEENIALALQKINQIRVLCAVREGEQGIYHINDKIERILSQRGYLSIHSEFYQNRPIIVTSNNRELGLFNGDVGIIRNENGQAYAWFEDGNNKLKKVLPALIGNFETVFAMTIHKSQGSEYERVLLILPKTENLPLLTKELLYTGITRAKKKVIIQAEWNNIKETIKKRVERASGISSRFN